MRSLFAMHIPLSTPISKQSLGATTPPDSTHAPLSTRGSSDTAMHDPDESPDNEIKSDGPRRHDQSSAETSMNCESGRGLLPAFVPCKHGNDTARVDSEAHSDDVVIQSLLDIASQNPTACIVDVPKDINDKWLGTSQLFVEENIALQMQVCPTPCRMTSTDFVKGRVASYFSRAKPSVRGSPQFPLRSHSTPDAGIFGQPERLF